jgi:serine protease AprX
VSDHVQPAWARTATGRCPALAAGCLLLAALLTPAAGLPGRGGAVWLDVLVQGRGAAAALAAAGGRPLAGLPIVDGVLGRVPAEAARHLRRAPGVRAVLDAGRQLRVQSLDPASLQPTSPAGDRAAAAASSPGDGLDPIDRASPRPEPLRAGLGLGVAVALLDTGIAASGDLAGQVVARTDLSGEQTFSDSYGHGTFMAGLIAGSGRGGGPAGVAPAARLVDLKVAGAAGSTTLGRVLLAMQLADAGRGHLNLRVLNLSLAVPADDPAVAPLTEAVERLWADGITVVAAAGNGGGGVDAPGIDPYVVTVGALDPTRAGQPVAPWSNRGPDVAGRPKPDLAAPGVDVVSLRAPGSTIDLANPAARVGDAYFRGSGTSMSTAQVAGAAAAVAAAHPDWDPDQVKAALVTTARPLGAGLAALDLEAALGLASVKPANGDLLPLLAAGRAPASLQARALPAIRWVARHWAARHWAARHWAARHWATALP